MKKRHIILIGAGGHAKSCIDVIESEGKFNIKGLVGLNEEVGKSINGYEVLGTDEDLYKLAKSFKHALIGFGQIQSPEKRKHYFSKAQDIGFTLPTVISATALSSKYAQIGEGSIIMHGAIINAGAQVGDNCIINSRALIEHDSQISSHCHISTGALVNGNTSIGVGSFIGSGTIIKEGLSIGEYSVVGMGNVLTVDLEPRTKIIGGVVK